jgi:tRNA1(Val) A37 N6-methylase TrmN6
MSSVLTETYDKIFFCPPYYDLELYGGENQSTTLYSDYDTWLDEYWRQTVQECDKVLKEGGVFSFVMGALCREKTMASDMLKIAEEKFTLVDELRILPPTESTKAANVVDKYEICYILKKP